MSSIDELRKKRDAQISGLKRIHAYVMSFDSVGYDISELEVREERLLIICQSFEDFQTRIEEIDPSESDDVRDLFERTFFEARARIRTLVKNSKSQIDTIKQCTPNGVRLPEVDLPKFNGEIKDWPNFRDLFQILIHENDQIAPIQKFMYLKGATSHTALNILQSIPVTNGNYNLAWQSLLDRYEDPQTIAASHLKVLCKDSMLKRKPEEIRQLINDINQNLSALQVLGLPVVHWDTILIYLATRRLDQLLREKWYRKILNAKTTDHKWPTLKQFTLYLETECKAMESAKPDEKVNIGIKHQIRSSMHITSKSNDVTCPTCEGAHKIFNCPKFMKMNTKERNKLVKDKNLCYNCLKTDCSVAKCVSRSCVKCKRKHNTLLHFDYQGNNSKDTSTLEIDVKPTQGLETENNKLNINVSAQPVHGTTLHCARKTSQTYILLWTATVLVKDKSGNVQKCRALLDNGSQTNFVTSQYIQSLQLCPTEHVTKVSGVSATCSSSNFIISLQVMSRISAFKRTMEFVVLDKITCDLPTSAISSNNIRIPSGLTLADPEYFKPNKIDMLLGGECFGNLLKRGLIQMGHKQPTLFETTLGWVVAGQIENVSYQQTNTASYLCVNSTDETEKIDKLLTKFWLIEECVKEPFISNEDKLCEDHYVSTTKRDENGRYIVELPLTSSPNTLGNSFNEALRRFYQLEKRFLCDPSLRVRYSLFMNEYESLGHMEKIEQEPNNSIKYFLPHHPVFKESSETTKLRIVFDASTKTDFGRGPSLNDISMVGPVVQDELFSIIIRFRMHTYVFSADIIKMYRQIKVNPKHHDLQCIIWRYSPEEQLSIYKLKTVTYGTASAPYLATRTLKQVASDAKQKYPLAAQVIKDFYVDDVLSGSNTEHQAKLIIDETISMLQQGGFELSKWASNHPSLLSRVFDINKNQTKLVSIINSEVVGVLGLQWKPSTDELNFSRELDPDQYCNTKRKVLSAISKVFDPLGLIGPVVINAKIMIQTIWKLKMDWDDTLPPNIQHLWDTFYKDLSTINTINIPRQVTSVKNNVIFDLHGFCDASERAYGAAIYVRCYDDHGEITSHLLTAKSRVAPVQSVSIPRLELCGALLLSELIKTVNNCLTTKPVKVYLWCDSMVTLAWIAACPTKWKQFVANRVSKIQQLTSEYQWRHVKSEHNPADLLSRGVSASALANNSLWWRGPPWLYCSSEDWTPNYTINLDDANIPESKKPKEQVNLLITYDSLCEKYSSWSKLIRTTAFIFRFINNSCHRSKQREKQFGALSNKELQHARYTWCKIAQAEHFANEISKLKKNKQLPKTSKLLCLAPFIDKDNLLRVGGRLRHAAISTDKKHPILLPKNHTVTRLIANYLHATYLHIGTQGLLSIMRQRYWPLSGRNLCKKTVHTCVICFKIKPTVQQPVMGQLPFARITPSKPFLKTGLDFCGPVYVRQSLNRRSSKVKTYIAVFVCMAIKAIHLELVSDLSTRAFLAALQRFISRRGLCKEIHCDNGTNFVGAAKTLNEMHKFILNNHTQFELVNIPDPIEWHFIPPSSPHMGGLWEASVKSVKFHLCRIMKNECLTYEEVSTLLTQIEACLNSRPLTLMSNDPNDPRPLTPAHFLIGDSLVLPIERDVTQDPVNYNQRWKQVQSMFLSFWKRWSNDYLTTLQHRPKWHKQTPNIELDNVVMIREPNLPPSNWILGRVIQVHPGLDGTIRVATVKTSRGIIKRPAIKLCKLPIG